MNIVVFKPVIYNYSNTDHLPINLEIDLKEDKNENKANHKTFLDHKKYF